MLEAGLKIKRILPHLNDIDLEFAFISHAHGDHSQSAKKIADYGIDILCSNGTAEKLGLMPSEYIVSYNQSGMRTRQLHTLHNCVEPTSLLVDSGNERLYFITDSEYCPHKIDGISTLMIEANWSKYTMKEGQDGDWVNDRALHSHQSLERALEWVRDMDKSKLERVILIHLSNNNSDVDFFIREMQAVTGVPVDIAGA